MPPEAEELSLSPSFSKDLLVPLSPTNFWSNWFMTSLNSLTANAETEDGKTIPHSKPLPELLELTKSATTVSETVMPLSPMDNPTAAELTADWPDAVTASSTTVNNATLELETETSRECAELTAGCLPAVMVLSTLESNATMETDTTSTDVHPFAYSNAETVKSTSETVLSNAITE